MRRILNIVDGVHVLSMSNSFFEHPILNSPYDYPARHWELDAHGQPTQQIAESRRTAEFITPIPNSRKPCIISTLSSIWIPVNPSVGNTECPGNVLVEHGMKWEELRAIEYYMAR